MKKGFSLLEVVIVVFFISVLGAIVAQGVASTLRDGRRLEAKFQIQRESAIALDRMTRVLRSTTQIIAAGPNSITIRGYPTVADSVPSEIRYFVENQRLRFSVIPPSGVAPNYSYNPAHAVTHTLIGRVVNDSTHHLFSYYDETNLLISGTIDIARIRSIGINPRVLDSTNFLTTPLSISTTVMLRNFKTNL